MAARHVVVDGSNLATEGRSLPSLKQLDEAVRAYKAEWPDDDVLVVVDASFSYRIDESERKMFEGAEQAGELVSPPAGAVGRGDGFLLRIADRTDAVVLSNDSFQEFHGEYPWLFDEGRLVGGKPVPGVGWIFTPRSPVRGPKSRVAVRDARKSRRGAERVEPVAQAIAEATAEAVSPEPEPRSSRRGGRRRGRGAPSSPEAVNEPLPFITFIAEHRLGTEVEGTVESFTSHGAFIVADGARCYAPVVGLGDPPPRSAKDVLKRGETRTFVVQALDPPRRGIELALPGLAKVAGAPTEETVEAEIDVGAKPSRRRRGVRKAASTEGAPEPAPVAEPPSPQAAPPAKRARRAPARKTPAVVAAGDDVPEKAAVAAPPARRARKASARKAPADDAAPVSDVAAESAVNAPAKKTARPKKAAPKAPAPAAEEATADGETAAARPAADGPVKKAAPRKAAAKKAATITDGEAAPKKAPARKAPAAKKAATAKVHAEDAPAKKAAPPAAATAKAAPKKAAAKKVAPKKVAPKKAPAKKAPAKKAAAPAG